MKYLLGVFPNSTNYFLSIQFLPIQLFTVIFMTPTREQLELAAKAAGYSYKWQHSKFRVSRHDTNGWSEAWYPVKDASDNLNLRDSCEINISYFISCVAATSRGKTIDVYYSDYKDKNDATRWASFLCAVEIGRAM
jgi:hypothetical protein